MFIVWDLVKNQIILNQETLQSLNFPGFTSSSSVFCRNFTSLYNKIATNKANLNKNKKNLIETINTKFGSTEFMYPSNDQIILEQIDDNINISSIWESHHSLASIAGGIFWEFIFISFFSIKF